MRAHRVLAVVSAIAALGIDSVASGQAPAPPPVSPPAAAPPAAAPPAAIPPYGTPPYGTQPYGAQPYYGPPPYGYPPGYQPYGAAWGTPGAGQKLPAKLDYEEGAPIPFGYHLEERVRRGPVIGGAITGGIGYLIVGLPVLTAWNEVDNSTRALAVPVLGPWVTLATYDRCDEGQGWCFDSLINMLLVIDGAMQATGAILLTYGLASKKKMLIRDDLATGPRITTFGPTSFGPSSMGLAVGGEL